MEHADWIENRNLEHPIVKLQFVLQIAVCCFPYNVEDINERLLKTGYTKR